MNNNDLLISEARQYLAKLIRRINSVIRIIDVVNYESKVHIVNSENQRSSLCIMNYALCIMHYFWEGSMDLSHLAAGTYFVKVNDRKPVIVIKK